MSRSTTANYTVTGTDIINAAAEDLGIRPLGETLDSNISASWLRALNLIVKNRMGLPNRLNRGLKIWQRSRFSFTLHAQNYFDIYNNPTITIVTFGSLGSATVAIDINGTTNTLTEGVDWDAETSNTVTATNLAAALNALTGITATSSGAVVTITVHPDYYAEDITLSDETNMTVGNEADLIMDPPVNIKSLLLRESDSDYVMKEMTWNEYEAIGGKSGSGDPTKWLQERLFDRMRVRFNCTPSDITKTIEGLCLRPLADIDSASDNLDFPQEWFLALKYMLAVDRAPWAGKPLNMVQDLIVLRDEAIEHATTFHPETNDIYFQPDKVW